MATTKNLVIDQGQTFTFAFSVKNADGTAKDLTTYTVASQMRKSYHALTAVSFTTSKVDITGEITISLTNTASSGIKPGRYVYDVEISSVADTLRVREGIITVTPEVTK